MTPSRNGDSRQDGVAAGAHGRATLWYHDAECEAIVRAELSEPDTEDYRLVTDCQAGEASPEERELYELRRRTDPEFDELAESLEVISEHLPHVAQEEQSIQTASRAEKRARWRRLRSYAFTTIGLTVAAWLGNFIRQQWVPVPSAYVHADAPANQPLSEKLPDDTRVTLAPGAHLSYLQWFGKARDDTLTLDGEATFTVAPGGRLPLVVAGTGVEVTAVEGQFSIGAFAASPLAYVYVREGRAQVRPRARTGYGEALTLQAGEGAVIGPGLHIQRVELPITPQPLGTDTRGVAPLSGASPRPASGKRGVADHQEFVDWPSNLAPRAPAFADSIERDFGERPYTMTFVARDTLRIAFWNPSFWRGNQGSKLPQESLPLVSKAARHVAAYVLNGFGRDAGVDVVILTFIRVRRGIQLVRVVPVPAQEVTTLYSRKMFEPHPPELPILAISER